MAERVVWDDFSVRLDWETVQERLCLADEEDIGLVKPLFEEAVKIARPKAVFRVCYVDGADGDAVTVEGTVFRSAVMAKKLAEVHRVFAYVATCGAEVDDWSHKETDYFTGLWLDMIKEYILMDANEQFIARMKETYGLQKVASMNPGSSNADVWPIAQQRPLFDLIGGVPEIGVRLTESFLMVPTKTVSGILFPTGKEYVNCELCTRERCPNRKAAYNPAAV